MDTAPVGGLEAGGTKFVCAVGRATGPQQERGVFRTKDGGAT